MGRAEREALEAALEAWRWLMIQRLYRRGYDVQHVSPEMFVRHWRMVVGK